MIKKQSWLLLALLAALVGFALFLKNKPESDAPEAGASLVPSAEPVEYLFPADEGTITSLLVESRDGNSLGMERGDQAWVATRPFAAELLQASVEEAASQISALTVVSRLELDPSAAGLTSPAYAITVGFDNGNFILVQVGNATPTDSGYYVRKQDGSILIVSKFGLEALFNLLLYPPYVSSPTPSPSPATETPTPSATSAPVSETPTATKTP